MNSTPSPQEEISRLVDLMVDRQIDASGYARLESLLRSDQRCLQAYVDRLHFHSELIQFSDFRTSEAVVLERLADYETSQEHRYFAPILAMCALVLVAIGSTWGYFSYGRPAPAVGTVAGMTADADFKTTAVKPGELIRRGQTIQLLKGILTVRFGEVTVDLLAPVTVQVQDRSLMHLREGRLIANVKPAGIGYTVVTPDAETVDLGTQFMVSRSRESGTQVSVRQGRVHASLLSRTGARQQVMEITTARSARFSVHDAAVAEEDFDNKPFDVVANARGQITSFDGLLRTSTEKVSDLRSGKHYTPNFIQVIPEHQNISIDEPLTVKSFNGAITLPKGSVIGSYLVHYEPDTNTFMAPRGAVHFDAPIAAILVDQKSMALTDSLFGYSDVVVEQDVARGLELDEDEIRISDDKKTVSFYFGASGGKPVDQARILVIQGNVNTH